MRVDNCPDTAAIIFVLLGVILVGSVVWIAQRVAIHRERERRRKARVQKLALVKRKPKTKKNG